MEFISSNDYQMRLLHSIVDTENEAAAISGEARSKKAALEDDLSAEIAEMRREYFERAELRIAKIRDEEQKKTDEELEQLDRSLKDRLSRVEEVYSARRDEWVRHFFELAVSG